MNKINPEILKKTLLGLEKEIKHKEYEIRMLKAEWDRVYGLYLGGLNDE